METRYIYVSSENRDINAWPSANTYVMDLIEPIRDIVEVNLLSARVPNTIYNITLGSNLLTINTTNVSVAPGFYTQQQIVSSLVGVPAGITVSFQAPEGRFMFQGNTLTSVTVNTEEAQQMFGFGQNTTVTYVTDPLYPATRTIKSPLVSDPLKASYIFLDIDELKSPYIHDTRSDPYATALMNHCFAVIPLDCDFGTFKTFKESDFKLPIKFKHPISSLSRLTIRWIDKNGVPINFNGLDDNSFVIKVCNQARSLDHLKGCQN